MTGSVRGTGNKKQPPTVGAQLQWSLSRLMNTLNQANPYFIRCIKSNTEKAPCVFDEELVMRQLRYTGMLATVKIRQSGYNYRLLLNIGQRDVNARLAKEAAERNVQESLEREKQLLEKERQLLEKEQEDEKLRVEAERIKQEEMQRKEELIREKLEEAQILAESLELDRQEKKDEFQSTASDEGVLLKASSTEELEENHFHSLVKEGFRRAVQLLLEPKVARSKCNPGKKGSQLSARYCW